MIILLFFTIISSIIIHNVTFYLVLMTFVWMGQALTAEIMYFITGSFLSLAYNLTTSIPYGSYHCSQIFAAIKRMDDIFKTLEITVKEKEPTEESKEPQINIIDLSVMIGEKTIYKDVNLKVEKGLTLILGPPTSGKTVFLLTLLKEFDTSSGFFSVKGKISYASQEPWLFPGSIRQNILFGSKYEEKRYKDVLHACDLEFDLNLLEKGDSTIIIDRGINLSKGQQSRINLARAIYREADIYLLDDCLCSLDTLVAKHIFTVCMMKFLCNKLIILVSNNMNLVSYANNIVTFEKDEAVSFRENPTPKVIEAEDEEPTQNEVICYPVIKSNFEMDLSESKLLLPKKKRMYEEKNQTGTVSFQVYHAYLKFGGGITFFAFILILFFCTQLSITYKDNLISQWANLEEQLSLTNRSQVGNHSDYLEVLEKRNDVLYQYSGCVLAICIFTFSRAFCLFIFAKRVSYRLHSKMINRVLNSTLQFFDGTFIGNLINRFSKDLVIIDEIIPFVFYHLTAILLETIGNLILISSSNLKFLIPTAILSVCIGFLRHGYLKSGRALKRLDSSTKSPVVGYINSTWEGLATIKAFGAEKIITEEFDRAQNVYTSASYCSLYCLKAFILVSDIFIAIFVTVVVIQFAIFEKDVAPGDVGLVISQAFVMGKIFFFALIQWAQLETYMTSVERAVEYTTIQQEPKAGLKLDQWPNKGEIKYENVYLTINKKHLLYNINLLIRPKEKIGIIGRTGAGKSSVVSALFRLYEYKGKILIDGIDIKTLSLDCLRSNLSIIPQDSVLLNDSLRCNLDPGNARKDEEIWRALESVGLNQITSSLDVNIYDLDITCGQRQLICLARVLLKDNSIVILDEMSENIDSETENLINEIVDKNFQPYTVIKITHKLKYVMECDRIIVIDKGQVVEFDRPQTLIENKKSLFYKMTQTTDFVR